MCCVIIGQTTSGRKAWQEEEDTRKDFSIVLILQEQSWTSELFKAIQDAISLILLYRTMLLFRAASSSTFIMSDVQSICIPSSIRDCQNLSNRQTVFFTSVVPMNKEHKDPVTIDLNEPRHAQYMHQAWKKHQNTVYWVNINLALKKGLKFYQTRSDAIIFYDTLPAYCIPKAIMMGTGEVIYEKVYASPRPPPKISLKHDWMKELGSEVARRPEGHVVQQFKSSQSNQPDPSPDHDDRTGTPVVCRDASHAQGASQTRSSHESTNFNVEDETNHDRTGTPVVCRDASHAQGHEQSMLTEMNIDFRIPGLPHSVVKQAENSRVRELVKKIENHPDRHALQRDLQQNKAYNPFSVTTENDSGRGQRRAV